MGPSGKVDKGGHKSGLCAPAPPFPVKESVARGVDEVGLRGRVDKSQWDHTGEGGKNEAHKGL